MKSTARGLALAFALFAALALPAFGQTNAPIGPGGGSGGGGGGGGTPGGSPGQVQYNNSNIFGGTSGLTTDGTNVTISTGTGTLTAGTGLVVSGTNSVSLNNNTVFEYLTPNARFSLPSSESFYFYNQGRGVNLLMELNGSTGAVNIPELTASELVVTDGSKNLASSPYGSGVLTALGDAVNASGGFPTVPVANAQLANSSATVNGTTCTLGSSCTVTAPSYYLSGNWYFPFGINSTSAGSATTANTIYCAYGGVTAKVTIKTLGLYLVTGITTDTLQLAIYSQSGGTLTLVDNTGNIAAGTAQSGTAINGGVSNTTDVLNPGVLYAFCENSPGAMVFTAVSTSGLGGQAAFIGSATQSNINLVSTGVIQGRSIAQTYTSGWPGTITESSMSDVTTALTPLISFQVN